MPLDRLKLAREDFDIHEKLYSMLVLGIRFFVGTVALLGGWSLSLVDTTAIWSRTGWFLAISTVAFWSILAIAIYHLFVLFKGDHWVIPRTFDCYAAWEKKRLGSLKSGTFDLAGKTPEQFAEDEMVEDMTNAFADCASVNRVANLARQKRITIVGKVLLISSLSLGMQGLAYTIHRQSHGNPTEQPAVTAPASTTAAPGPGAYRPDGPQRPSTNRAAGLSDSGAAG